jgi:hypothetical protein
VGGRDARPVSDTARQSEQTPPRVAAVVRSWLRSARSSSPLRACSRAPSTTRRTRAQPPRRSRSSSTAGSSARTRGRSAGGLGGAPRQGREVRHHRLQGSNCESDQHPPVQDHGFVDLASPGANSYMWSLWGSNGDLVGDYQVAFQPAPPFTTGAPRRPHAAVSAAERPETTFPTPPWPTRTASGGLEARAGVLFGDRGGLAHAGSCWSRSPARRPLARTTPRNGNGKRETSSRALGSIDATRGAGRPR